MDLLDANINSPMSQNKLARKEQSHLAMRACASSELGAQNEDEVLDEKQHRMQLKLQASKPVVKENEGDEVFCSNCNDAIDVVLGYFSCQKCKIDYCRECALDRDRLESEMAEDPIFVPTPMTDILRDSNKNATKQFNQSIMQHEVARGSSFAVKKELQQNAGQFLTSDLKFDFELQELGITAAKFNEVKATLFE